MLLSSSRSIAFTLAIISPTGLSSVTLIVFKGNGLKKKYGDEKMLKMQSCMRISAELRLSK